MNCYFLMLGFLVLAIAGSGLVQYRDWTYKEAAPFFVGALILLAISAAEFFTESHRLT